MRSVCLIFLGSCVLNTRLRFSTLIGVWRGDVEEFFGDGGTNVASTHEVKGPWLLEPVLGPFMLVMSGSQSVIIQLNRTALLALR